MTPTSFRLPFLSALVFFSFCLFFFLSSAGFLAPAEGEGGEASCGGRSICPSLSAKKKMSVLLPWVTNGN